MDPLIWPAILLFVGLGLLALEVFIPSGGILGFLSIAAIISGIGLAFYQLGSRVGFVFLSAAAILIPAVLMMAFRFWPQTPMGRKMLASLPTEEEVRPDNPERQLLRQLVGKYGVARTVMLPSGAVDVEGHTIDAVSEGMPIDQGQPIQVVEVQGTRVIVRPVDSIPEQRKATSDSNDVLSRPIEAVFDPFEDPLV